MADQVVFPSSNAVGDDPADVGRGAIWTEEDARALFQAAAGGQSAVISGLEVTTSGLLATIQTGEAIIAGQYVKLNVTKSLSLASSGSFQVMLKVDRTSGLATAVSAAQQANAFGEVAVPADHILLAVIDTAAGVVTTNRDARPWHAGSVRSGVYLGDGTSLQDVVIGAAPKLLFVADTLADYWSVSFPTHLTARKPSEPGSHTFGFGVFTRQEAVSVPDRQVVDVVIPAQGFGVDNKIDGTVFFAGAAVGDPVFATFTYNGIDAEKLVTTAAISAAETATWRIFDTSGTAPNVSGTVRIERYINSTVSIPVPILPESGLTQSVRPRIMPTGFRVAGSLNIASRPYSWVGLF